MGKVKNRKHGLSRYAVTSRYKSLKGDRTFSPEKDALLRLTARLIIHHENLSKLLFSSGYDNADYTSKIVELSFRIEHLLKKVFEDDEPGEKKLSITERMEREADRE